MAQQVDLYERAGHNVAPVVEFKGYRNVVASLARSLAVRQQATVQIIQGIHLIIIRRTEVSRADGRQGAVILLRYIGTEKEASVLCDAYQRLPHAYVITFLDQQAFDVSTYRSGDGLSVIRMVLCNRLVADAGVLIRLFGLCKFFFRDNAAFHECLHAFVFLFGYLVGYARFLYGVSLGHPFGRKNDQRAALRYLHAFGDFVFERHHTGHGGNGHPLVALCGENLSAGFDYLREVARLHNACLYAGGLGLGRGHYDFVGGFSMLVSFVVVTVPFFFVGMLLVIVHFGRMVVPVVVRMGRLVVTGAQ